MSISFVLVLALSPVTGQAKEPKELRNRRDSERSQREERRSETPGRHGMKAKHLVSGIAGVVVRKLVDRRDDDIKTGGGRKNTKDGDRRPGRGKKDRASVEAGRVIGIDEIPKFDTSTERGYYDAMIFMKQREARKLREAAEKCLEQSRTYEELRDTANDNARNAGTDREADEWRQRADEHEANAGRLADEAKALDAHANDASAEANRLINEAIDKGVY